MSCSKWRWKEVCDSEVCVGDCDVCHFDPIEGTCMSCKWNKAVVDEVDFHGSKAYLHSYECVHPDGDRCEDNEFWEGTNETETDRESVAVY